MARKKAETTTPPEVEVPSTAGMVLVERVDGFDPEWWPVAKHAASYPSVDPRVADIFRLIVEHGHAIMSVPDSKSVYIWAETVSGWSDPDQPWAPHPIRYTLLDK